LEFTLTFIVGMEEDLLPHVNAKGSFSELEEERRLCYVGMTRAKKFLYLTGSSFRFVRGALQKMDSSRFLSEISSQYLVVLSEDLEEEIGESGYATGAMIVHKDFGKGVIKKVYHTSLGLTYDVEFLETRSTRSLVGKYAKLQLCKNS